jgi:hypothetical protein
MLDFRVFSWLFIPLAYGFVLFRSGSYFQEINVRSKMKFSMRGLSKECITNLGADNLLCC